jgi:hypothetical protein
MYMTRSSQRKGNGVYCSRFVGYVQLDTCKRQTSGVLASRSPCFFGSARWQVSVALEPVGLCTSTCETWTHLLSSRPPSATIIRREDLVNTPLVGLLSKSRATPVHADQRHCNSASTDAPPRSNVVIRHIHAHDLLNRTPSPNSLPSSAGAQGFQAVSSSRRCAYLKFLPSAHSLPSTMRSQAMAASKNALSSAFSRSIFLYSYDSQSGATSMTGL